MMRLAGATIRASLAAWTAGLLALALTAYTGATLLFLNGRLTNDLYRQEVQDLATVEGLLYFAPDGTLRLHDEYHSRPRDKQLLRRLLEVRTLNGQVLFRNERLAGRDLGGAPSPGEGVNRFDRMHLRLADGTDVQRISRVHTIDGRDVLIRNAYSTDDQHETLIEVVETLLQTLPIALLLAAGVAFVVADRALRPLRTMAAQAAGITARRMHERLPVHSEDELGQMAMVTNRMLERLEQSFLALQRFTSDVAHELRTPLAALRGVGEVGLAEETTIEGHREVIGSMLEEVSRLNRLVETMLTIARAEAGQIPVARENFALDEMVRGTAALLEVLAEEQHQHLELKLAPVTVYADRELLRQAVLNVLGNAIRYAGHGGTIRLEAEKSAAGATLRIADDGPGIPPELRDRIFERFYRVGADRASATGGAGLGLAIARWAVEANGGTLRAEPAVERGACFVFQLPAAEA